MSVMQQRANGDKTTICHKCRSWLWFELMGLVLPEHQFYATTSSRQNSKVIVQINVQPLHSDSAGATGCKDGEARWKQVSRVDIQRQDQPSDCVYMRINGDISNNFQRLSFIRAGICYKYLDPIASGFLWRQSSCKLTSPNNVCYNNVNCE